MSLTQQTWRLSSPYTYTPAGTYATPAEVLSAINSMLVTETAGVGLWGVSNYNAGNGTLEIKRNGSQTGLMSTFRGLMFGGSAPHVNAMFNSTQSKDANSVYVGSSDNAGTTGPEAAYTAGDPYPSSRWSGGVRAMPGSQIAKVNNPYVMLAECDRVLIMLLNDGSNGGLIIMGECIETPSGGSIFGTLVSTACAVGTIPGGTTTFANTASQSFVPFGTSGAANISGSYNTSGAKRGIGIVSLMAQLPSDPFFDGSSGMLLVPLVAVGYDSSTSYTTNASLIGVMRQMKAGPLGVNRLSIRDALNVEQALHIAAGSNKSGVGMYLDQFV